MHNLNRERYRQMPEYREEMTQLKEEYPKVRNINTKYDLLIFLTYIIIFITTFILLDKIFLLPSSNDKFKLITIFSLMLSLVIGHMAELHLLDFKDEAIDKYVAKEKRKQENEPNKD